MQVRSAHRFCIAKGDLDLRAYSLYIQMKYTLFTILSTMEEKFLREYFARKTDMVQHENVTVYILYHSSNKE